MVRTISTDEAPAAVGAYSQGTTNGDLVFTSGQIPMTPEGDLLRDEPIEAQTEQSLRNVRAVLRQEGCSMNDVLKVTVYLDDIDEFEAMNEVYRGFFDSAPPSRSAIEVGSLPKGVGVEIEAVAAIQ